MNPDQEKLINFIFDIVKAGWANWEESEYGYARTAVRYVTLIREYVNKNHIKVVIDYVTLKRYFIRFFDTCFARNEAELKLALLPSLAFSGAIRFSDKANLNYRPSNKEIRSSYKRIDAVLYSFGHSFMSLMNSPVEELIYYAIKKQNIKTLKIQFSRNKIYPTGEYPKEIWDSMGYYMKWLPSLASSQNVDSDKIKNIVLTIEREPGKFKVLVSATDDRGVRHTTKIPNLWS
ncbi:MAG: hypothetical protein PHH69_05320 [Candidatus Omnitrophica bacterium]|nr:hypothetical protein [Candidatus Omnitrophota bacterium]MDD5610943.1 hypothetical protein [Candidatus Omnitrophota bacterium]